MGQEATRPADATVLDRLYKVIESRKGADPARSGTARLFAKGTEKIAQKVGEEAVETIIEGLKGKKKDLAAESADLLYHLLVLWADRNLKPAEVWATLSQRSGVSGKPPPPEPRAMAYDPKNIFARILRGEIPCKKVYEDDDTLAFHDIHPQAKVHVLVIPKGAYVSMEDFSQRASEPEIAALVRAVGKVARDLGLVETGYRILANHGPDSHQEVPHLHIHIFGGQRLGRMIQPLA
jgi:histidine triad (HIT) family protein